MNEYQYRESLKSAGITLDEETIQHVMQLIGIEKDNSTIEELDEVVIIDDVITEQEQNLLESHFLSDRVEWEKYNSTLYDNNGNLANPNDYFPQTKNTLDTKQQVNVMVFNGHGNYDIVKPIVDKIPYKYSKILRIKANLTEPTNTDIDYPHSPIHTDIGSVSKYITCIYYINDSDGDTIIFNEKKGFCGTPTIKQTIKPKKGRLVMFNGHHLHAGELPRTNEKRLVLNINIT
jgi:hypothetical protein